MSYLKFDIESCKDCYSCLRNCPVKAITFKDDKAIILENECILCGHCVNVCPQNAKKIVSDLDKVKSLIKKYPSKVALSVAPSFISNFDVLSFDEFKNCMKKLGFSIVEETAVGAYFVTKEYEKLITSNKYNNFITTACPAAVDFIRTRFPNAIKYLAPVVSPMVAHGKMIKKEYGEDFHVVFVGPCIAKKKEANESGIIDCALTFEELQIWLDEEKLCFDNDINIVQEKTNNLARYYPIQRGIIKSFEKEIDGFYTVSVDDTNEIINLLENIDELDHVFIEINMCSGGCINGPAKISKRSKVQDNQIVRKYVKNSLSNDKLKNIEVDLHSSFSPMESMYKIPSEEEIRKILSKISKYKKEDELNCGACGYRTCREKAIAVYNGLANIEYCLPYLKDKAESISNEIIQNSPNGIISIDEEGTLIFANQRALDYLQISKDRIGHNYQEVIELPELLLALLEKNNIESIIVYNDRNNMYFDVSITVVKEHKVAFAIYKDVTQEVLNDEKMKNLRNQMIEVTDQVINKQMAAVQEIASLLGESTAEAKIALVNFKNSLKDE